MRTTHEQENGLSLKAAEEVLDLFEGQEVEVAVGSTEDVIDAFGVVDHASWILMDDEDIVRVEIVGKGGWVVGLEGDRSAGSFVFEEDTLRLHLNTGVVRIRRAPKWAATAKGRALMADADTGE